MSKESKKQADEKVKEEEKNEVNTENSDSQPEQVEETPEISELEKARKEAAEYKDLALRRMAELENFRRNNQNVAKDVRDRTLSEVIREFLPAIDSFSRAEQMVQDDKTKSGIASVKDQLLNVLKKYGVTPIDAADNDFDPAYHECIMQVDSRDKIGKVIYEIEKGYMMGDKVLRYAKVAVGKQPEQQ